ncbi:MAG: hypothetical protein JWQ04_2968 [Pedosphaera sp.]|nr:hypothetical protein [Pedosphaera sp.]
MICRGIQPGQSTFGESKKVNAIEITIRADATREILSLIVKGSSDREAGRRALLIAFVLDPALIGTQKELSRRIGVSEGRASQMLKTIRDSLGEKIPLC